MVALVACKKCGKCSLRHLDFGCIAEVYELFSVHLNICERAWAELGSGGCKLVVRVCVCVCGVSWRRGTPLGLFYLFRQATTCLGNTLSPLCLQLEPPQNSGIWGKSVLSPPGHWRLWQKSRTSPAANKRSDSPTMVTSRFQIACSNLRFPLRSTRTCCLAGYLVTGDEVGHGLLNLERCKLQAIMAGVVTLAP